MKALCALLLFSLVATAAHAAEPPRYLDDRSDPAALVRSLYNAVSRKEYARAWSYFGKEKPAADLAAYAAGYKGIESVSVVTGAPTGVSDAGGTVFGIPVAIAAYAADGTEQVFAGCYTARMRDAGKSVEALAPLTLERGELRPAEQPFEEKLPERCGQGQPASTDALLERAKIAFASTHADQCGEALPPGVDAAALDPELYEFAFRYSYDAAAEPEHKVRLFRFFCRRGAYNEVHAFYLHDADNGLREAQFAMPDLDIRYENDDSEGKVESVTVVGFHAEQLLLNSDIDPTTRTITSWSKWRGIGDASSIGSWVFRDGQFSLVKFDVDASYDEEINPHTVVDYDTAP